MKVEAINAQKCVQCSFSKDITTGDEFKSDVGIDASLYTVTETCFNDDPTSDQANTKDCIKGGQSMTHLYNDSSV